MQQTPGCPLPQTATYSAKLDQSGRIVIPSELRERMHFSAGDELVLRESGGMVTLSSYDQVLADAQAYCMSLLEPGVSVVDELLAERREEAAREASEGDGHRE